MGIREAGPGANVDPFGRSDTIVKMPKSGRGSTGRLIFHGVIRDSVIIALIFASHSFKIINHEARL